MAFLLLRRNKIRTFHTHNMTLKYNACISTFCPRFRDPSYVTTGLKIIIHKMYRSTAKRPTAILIRKLGDGVPPPLKGVSTLSWWWGLCDSDPESNAGDSLTTSRATHAGKVKG
jgi:hypothetical protein